MEAVISAFQCRNGVPQFWQFAGILDTEISVLSRLIVDNLRGQPIQAADPLSSGSSRLKAGCGQDCPPHSGRAAMGNVKRSVRFTGR
jgi:hypothetical protein